MFVLDASVTMAWCFPDETTPFTEAVLERLRTDGAQAPAIWPLEIVNVLLVGERRGRLTAAQSARFISLLSQLPISVAERRPLQELDSVLALGRTYRLAAYDAAYLDLAMTQALPLATTDNRLAEAAQLCGITLVSATGDAAD